MSERTIGCITPRLESQPHEPPLPGQRYLDGVKCRPLRVQSTKAHYQRIGCKKEIMLDANYATNQYERLPVTDQVPRYIKLSRELVTSIPPEQGAPIVEWIKFLGKWILIWFWFLLILVFGVTQLVSGGIGNSYPGYKGWFWGHFWAAKSSREHSKYKADLEANPELQIPFSIEPRGRLQHTSAMSESGIIDPNKIYRAHWPRQLMVRLRHAIALKLDIEQPNEEAETNPDGSENIWVEIFEGFSEKNDHFLKTEDYLAISYRRGAYRIPNGEMSETLFSNVRKACDELELDAYWLDEHCMGETEDQKNHDLFRIADVFRGAKKIVVMLPSHKIKRSTYGPDRTRDDNYEWEMWGTRTWTFPEALLSNELYLKIGTAKATRISIRQFHNVAFRKDRDQVAEIIDHYSGKDVMTRIQALSLLKQAIWRRHHPSDDHRVSEPNALSNSVPLTGDINERRMNETIPPPRAECVYALMGFFPRRIMPNNYETEEQALARLSMANDTDRFAERMIAMLPSQIDPNACWYSDNDLYGSNLWDIEPDVQVAGINKSSALILDGCRIAAIHWNNYPYVGRLTSTTNLQLFCLKVPPLFPIIFVFACIIVKFSNIFGAIFIILSFLGMAISPWMIVYGNAVKILAASPSFVGAEGVLSPDEVQFHVFGTTPGLLGTPRDLIQSPTGSIIAKPIKTGIIRSGLSIYADALDAERRGERIFTLIDTALLTVYYFSAARPPTICVYVGKEGGLGRFVLCSERCELNELHRETVLRMPSFLSSKMIRVDWVAIGSRLGAPEE